jgi:HSP20 family molecular chaperone IbpA
VIALAFEAPAEAVSANLDKGILRIDVAKPAEAKPTKRSIQIKGQPAAEEKPALTQKAA